MAPGVGRWHGDKAPTGAQDSRHSFGQNSQGGGLQARAGETTGARQGVPRESPPRLSHGVTTEPAAWPLPLSWRGTGPSAPRATATQTSGHEPANVPLSALRTHGNPSPTPKEEGPFAAPLVTRPAAGRRPALERAAGGGTHRGGGRSSALQRRRPVPTRPCRPGHPGRRVGEGTLRPEAEAPVGENSAQ